IFSGQLALDPEQLDCTLRHVVHAHDAYCSNLRLHQSRCEAIGRYREWFAGYDAPKYERRPMLLALCWCHVHQPTKPKVVFHRAVILNNHRDRNPAGPEFLVAKNNLSQLRTTNVLDRIIWINNNAVLAGIDLRERK